MASTPTEEPAGSGLTGGSLRGTRIAQSALSTVCMPLRVCRIRLPMNCKLAPLLAALRRSLIPVIGVRLLRLPRCASAHPLPHQNREDPSWKKHGTKQTKASRHPSRKASCRPGRRPPPTRPHLNVPVYDAVAVQVLQRAQHVLHDRSNHRLLQALHQDRTPIQVRPQSGWLPFSPGQRPVPVVP